MQIKSIGLKNFKRFKNINIKTPKITLLTGPNSSGKSSIIYGLLGALQTKNFPFYYSPNGDYVNMGDFEEFTNSSHTDEPFTISLSLSSQSEPSIDVTATFRSERSFPKIQSLRWSNKKYKFKFSEETEGGKYELEYVFLGKDDVKDKDSDEDKWDAWMRTLYVDLLPEKEGKKKDPEKFLGRSVSGSFSFTSFTDLKSSMGENMYLNKELSSISQISERLADSISYLSAFRLPPERTYYQKSKSNLKVGIYGENAIDQIFYWEDQKSPQMIELNEALKSLELADELTLQKHQAGRFEVRVKGVPGGKACSLLDVGFGISQFLPAIVADIQLPNRSTIVISQPEVHLHPSAQASYASWISNRTKKDKRHYILETHSEYIINRIRLMIAKEEIKEKDVALYYLDKTESPDFCHRIELKKNGAIIGAPPEFFDTYMIDTMDLALNS
jgi:predicted ATPase